MEERRSYSQFSLRLMYVAIIRLAGPKQIQKLQRAMDSQFPAMRKEKTAEINTSPPTATIQQEKKKKKKKMIGDHYTCTHTRFQARGWFTCNLGFTSSGAAENPSRPRGPYKLVFTRVAKPVSSTAVGNCTSMIAGVIGWIGCLFKGVRFAK